MPQEKMSVKDRERKMVNDCLNKILREDEKDRLSSSVIFWLTFLFAIAIFLYCYFWSTQ